jgi:hypothetical protein
VTGRKGAARAVAEASSFSIWMLTLGVEGGGTDAGSVAMGTSSRRGSWSGESFGKGTAGGTEPARGAEVGSGLAAADEDDDSGEGPAILLSPRLLVEDALYDLSCAAAPRLARGEFGEPGAMNTNVSRVGELTQ